MYVWIKFRIFPTSIPEMNLSDYVMHIIAHNSVLEYLISFITTLYAYFPAGLLTLEPSLVHNGCIHVEHNYVVIAVLLHISKQLLPGLLVDSAKLSPENELFPEGNARRK